MVRYSRLAYVALNVADLGRSRAFYEETVGLALEGSGPDGEAIFCAGPEQQLMLHASDRPGLKRLGWQMESASQLDLLRDILARHPLRVTEPAAMEKPHCLRIVEPNTGTAQDFLARPQQAAPAAGDGRVELLGHIVLRTPRYAQAVRFFKEALNFRASDEVDGWITFLRCFPNPLHHSIGIAAGERNMLHHVNFLLHSREDIDAAAARLRRSGVPIMCGPGRHVPSGSTFLYFLDPDGLTLEYSHGMERFAEIAPRPPRTLPAVKESIDLEAIPRDPRMFAIGEIETPERVAR